MSDLPFHELSVAVLRHIGDRQMFPAGLYFVNLGHPNQLFHVLAYALSLALPISVASKIVVTAAVIGIPLGAARLADHVGASRWAAVLISPVALGSLFFIGLVANLLGLALLLALLPVLDRFVAKPTAGGAWAVVGAFVALYLGHEAMMFLYAGALLVFVAAQPWNLRAHALRLGPFVFAVVLTYAQLQYQKPLFGPHAVVGKTIFTPLWLKIDGMPGVLFSAYDLRSSAAVFFVMLGVLAALGTQRVREARASAPPPRRGLHARLHALRFEAVAASAFLAYFAAPSTLNGATYVHERFLVPAFALLAIAASPRRTDGVAPALYRLTPLLAATVPLGVLFAVWPAFVESSQSSRDLDALLPLIEKGSAVAVTATPRDYHGYSRATLGAHAVVQRGGRLLYSFAESPISPVMIRADLRWNEAVGRIGVDEKAFCPSYDFTRFRYVLLNATDARLEFLMMRALSPEARLLDSRGEWYLFESTLKVVPADSPDGRPPPLCASDTLKARMKRILDADLANAARTAPAAETERTQEATH